MKLGVTHKLFLALFLAACLAVVKFYRDHGMEPKQGLFEH